MKVKLGNVFHKRAGFGEKSLDRSGLRGAGGQEAATSEKAKILAITSSKNDLALWTEGTVKPATGFTPLKISPNSTSIIELFEKQVDRTPHRAALKAQKTVVSYASLNRQANRVAHALLGDRKSTHPLVPLVMGHTPEKVIAAIGVLKAGLGYVTIDETAIDRVIQDLLNHTGAPLVITDVENFDRLRLLSDPRLKITLIDDLLQVGSEENPNVKTSPETIADVGYTSGSTGTPKGVVRTMAHEVHRVQSIYNTLKVGPEDTVAFLQNFWFTSLFLPLICGATASVFDLRNKKLSTMKRWLREARVSVYAGMVTGFSQLLKALNTNEFFSDMRVITLIGEPVHSTSLEKFRTAFPENCTLVSCYGSNEQAMIAKFVVGSESCPQQGGAVPVGFTDDETEVELIDRDFQVAPEGEIGEFAVTSPFPSSGYWQEPELTAKTWVRRGDNGPRIYLTGDLGRRDASGCLHVVGRKDDQIKIRGYRFLCSEVDAVLNGLPGIRQAAVAPFGGDVTDEKLACYYVSQSGEPLDVSELRTSLAEVLPSYMIPNAFLLIDELPLTESGKIKRRALPRPDLQGPGGCKPDVQSPGSDLETRLLVLWKRVLKTDRVGVTDNFFDLGGDSLAAMTLVYEIERDLRVELDLGLLLACPTIAEFVEHIDWGQIEPRSQVVPLQEIGERPSLYCLLGIHLYQAFADALGAGQPVFGVYVPHEDQILRAFSEGRSTDYSIEQLSDAYVEAIGKHQGKGPYRIAGFSFGGILAIETAIKLQKMGHKVDYVFLLDTPLANSWSRYWPAWVRVRLKWLLQGQWGPLYHRAKHKASRKISGRNIAALSGTNRADAGKLQRALFGQILRGYSGPKTQFEGTVVLLRTSQKKLAAEGIAVKSDYGWGQYFNNDFTVHLVPGDHLSMLQNPHVVELAKLVRAYL